MAKYIFTLFVSFISIFTFATDNVEIFDFTKPDLLWPQLNSYYLHDDTVTFEGYNDNVMCTVSMYNKYNLSKYQYDGYIYFDKDKYGMMFRTHYTNGTRYNAQITIETNEYVIDSVKIYFSEYTSYTYHEPKITYKCDVRCNIIDNSQNNTNKYQTYIPFKQVNKLNFDISYYASENSFWLGIPFIEIYYKENTTNISNIVLNNKENTIYSLNGTKQITINKGIYIINGKKYIKN